MEYELNIRQQYRIELNDEDLKTYLIPCPPESYDLQGHDNWNEVVGSLVMCIRYKTDVGDLVGALFYMDLIDSEVYEGLLSILHPVWITAPEAIKFGYTVEYDEEVTT